MQANFATRMSAAWLILCVLAVSQGGCNSRSSERSGSNRNAEVRPIDWIPTGSRQAIHRRVHRTAPALCLVKPNVQAH